MARPTKLTKALLDDITFYIKECKADKLLPTIEGLAVHNSAVGSLVCYSLGITNVPPLKYELSMDRFLYAEANYRAKVEDFFSHVEREKNMEGEKCGA